MFGLFGKTKAVKVRAVSDSRRFGVAAQSLKELIRKACDFLKVPVGGAHVCLSSDGTLVTEGLFGTLPEHCELVLLSRGQSWKGGEFTTLVNFYRLVHTPMAPSAGGGSTEGRPHGSNRACWSLLGGYQ
uniref:DNA fragmentation factor subunit beta n=1 Tax=Neogobius melanostomus TaxID=47308 RepID=A0A8C6U6T9_9GOBI